MADWTLAPPEPAAQGWQVTPPPDKKGWALSPPKNGTDVGVAGIVNTLDYPARAIAADVYGGIQGLTRPKGKTILPKTEEFQRARSASLEATSMKEGPVSKAISGVASIPGEIISETTKAISEKTLGPETTKRLAPAAEVAGDVLAIGGGGVAARRLGKAGKATKEAAPATPEKTFKSSPGKIAQEHADDVTNIETQAMKGAAAKAAPKKPPSQPQEPEASPAGSPRGPGPILEPPPVGETTKEAATRIDDGLYRMRKNATADKIEARQFLENVPEEISNPRVQDQLYTAIERQMVDPKAPIPPELQTAWKVLEPMKAEETATYERIRNRSPETAEQLGAPSEGYVHRVAKGKGSYFDAADPESHQGADPVLGTRSLSKFAPSLQARKFFVLEDNEGRNFVSNAAMPKDAEAGKTYTIGGKTGVLRPATTEEIEGNTATRYHKNAIVNTVDNVLRLKRVERNLDLLDQLKEQLKESGLAHQAEWTYRDEKGREIVGRANAKAPEGYQETTLPQFKGWVMDPKIKAVLDDFHNKPGSDLSEGLAKINRFLTGAIFITPIPHIKNVGAHWFTARGWDWIRPSGMRSLMQDTGRAAKAVLTQNEDYTRMLREGSGLLYGDVANQNFHKLMIEKLGHEMMDDEKGWAPIAKDFGFSSVADLVKTVYRTSSKILWAAGDMFMLQRQFELMRKGVPVRQAIREAERDIPNYRVPSEVMGSRMASQLVRNKNVMMFGAYRYGQFKAYATVARDLAKGTAEQRKEAAGKVFALAVLGIGVYGAANMALQSITGNKNANVAPSGPLSPIADAYGLSTGQKEWVSALSSIITPAPTLTLLDEVRTNKDVFGRPIIDENASRLGKGVQAGEAAVGATYPGQLLMESLKPGGAAQAAGRLAGVNLPPRASFKPGKRQFQQAGRREGQDEIEQTIKRIGK